MDPPSPAQVNRALPPSNRPRRRPRMRPPLPPANGLALHWRADGLGRRSPRPRARTRSRHRRIRVSARVRVRDGAASSTRGRPPRNHPKNPPNPVLFPALLTSCLMTPALHPFPISAFSFQFSAFSPLPPDFCPGDPIRDTSPGSLKHSGGEIPHCVRAAPVFRSAPLSALPGDLPLR